MFQMIRTRLYLTVFILSGIAIIIGLIGLSDIKKSNEDFKSVYENRIVPLSQLKNISDFYAINVVDTVHKTVHKVISMQEATKLLNEAKLGITSNWGKYTATELTAEEDMLVKKASSLFTPANQMIDQLLNVTRNQDIASLANIAAKELYTNIDPITSVISDLVTLQIKEAEKNNIKGIAEFEKTKLFFILLLIGGIGFSLAFAWYIVASIIKSINTLKNVMNLISTQKDLSHKIPSHSKDELGELSRTFNTLMQAVCYAIDNAKKTSLENAAVAEELSATSMQIGILAENSASEVDETTKMTESVADILRTSEESSDKSGNVISKVAEEVTDAAEKVLTVSADLQKVVENQSELSSHLERLNQEADQVKQILGVIADIAEQTNLLALNAAIEAARAGEHGRGFAVVADEVRKLAERTQKSLAESNATVAVIVQSVNGAADMMQKSAKEIQSLGKRAEKTEELMRATTGSIVHAKEIALQTVQDAKAGKSKTAEVITRIRKINEISTSNARSVEEIAAAAEHLARLSENLSAALVAFKTN